MSATNQPADAHGQSTHHDHHHESVINHETRDARARPLILGMAATFGVLFFAYLLIVGVLFLFGSNPQYTGNTLPPSTELRLPPSGPLLEQDGDIAGDLYIAEETEKLESYAWINRRAGTVRIPIERAMELTLERGVTGSE